MVQIKPFQGLRYNPKTVDNIQQVVAPPYDVISPAQQEAFYAQHPENVIRLILGKKSDADTDENNVYTRAHQSLEDWRQQGKLMQEDKPAFYAYSQTWGGITRTGFIALVKVEPFETGQVLPHEYTLGGPKKDRLALMQATGSILSPIFCLYDDPERQITLTPPEAQGTDLFEVTDQDGVIHRFWPITDTEIVSSLENLLKDKAILIADGHHRYETALNHRDWWRKTHHQEDAPDGSLPCDYTLAFLTNMAEPGLKVYPTHRVFHHLPEGWSSDKLQSAISQYFEPCDETECLFWFERPGQKKQGYRLRESVDLSPVPGPLQGLDAALIDHFVFNGLLGLPANELKAQGYLSFVRDDQEVHESLKASSEAAVFWLNAPSVQDVRDICATGLRMPQKSTYFYPKLLSGLVMYYFGAGKPVSVS